MKFMGWSDEELCHCRASIVETVIEMIGELDTDGDNGG